MIPVVYNHAKIDNFSRLDSNQSGGSYNVESQCITDVSSHVPFVVVPLQPVLYVAQVGNCLIDSTSHHVTQGLISDNSVLINQLDYCEKKTYDLNDGNSCFSNDTMYEDSGLDLDLSSSMTDNKDCQIHDVDFSCPKVKDRNNCFDICHKSHDLEYDRNVLNIVGLSQPFYSGNRVLVKVQGTQLESILDSGSPFSLVSKRLVHTIAAFAKCTLEKSTIPELWGASGDPLIILGMFKVKVQFGTHECEIYLHIIKRMPCDLILGNDYLEATSMQIDYGTHSATIPSYFPVKLIGDIAIAPNTSALVKANVCKIDKDMSTFAMLTVHDTLRKCTTGSRKGITHIQNGQVRGLLHNADREIMYLSDGDYIGKISLLHADVMVVDDKTQNVLNTVSLMLESEGNADDITFEAKKCQKSALYCENFVGNYTVPYHTDYTPCLPSISEEESVYTHCIATDKQTRQTSNDTSVPDLLSDCDNDIEINVYPERKTVQHDLWTLPCFEGIDNTDYSMDFNNTDYMNDQHFDYDYTDMIEKPDYFEQNMQANCNPYELNYNYSDSDLIELPWEVGRVKDCVDAMTTQQRIAAITSKIDQIKDFDISSAQRDRLFDVLMEYQDTLSFKETEMGVVRGYRGVLRLKPHKIFSVRPYTLSPFLRKILDEHIEKLLAKGVIEPSTSPYSHGVFLQPKACARGKTQEQLQYSDFRVLDDLRQLNKSILLPPHPIPNIQELIMQLSMETSNSNQCVYTVLDLDKGYYQVKLAPKSKIYTSFRTPRGVFQWTVLPQGVCSAPSTFCKIVYNILQPLIDKGVLLSYLDDLILFSSDINSHISTLAACLHRLSLYGIKIKLNKVQLMASSCTFLGFEIKNRCIFPLKHKIQALLDVPEPCQKKDVKKWTGLCNYYSRWIPSYAELSEPIYKTLRGSKFCWTEEARAGFLELKARFAQNIALMLPDFNRRFVIYTDSSSTTTSSILAQPYPEEGEGCEKPISFDSKLLRCGDIKMTIAFKELKAVVNALRSYERYVQYTNFLLRTDNKYVIALIKGKSYDLLPNKIARWLHFIDSFKFDIEYCHTSNNISDFFTRLSSPADKTENVSKIDSSVVYTQDSMSDNEMHRYFTLAVSSLREDLPTFDIDQLEGYELHALFGNDSVMTDGCHMISPLPDTVMVTTRGMLRKQRQNDQLQTVKDTDTLPDIQENPLEMDMTDTIPDRLRHINPSTAKSSWGHLQDIVSNYFENDTNDSKNVGKLTDRHTDSKSKAKGNRDLQEISSCNDAFIKQILKEENVITVQKWQEAQENDTALKGIIQYLRDDILPDNKRQAKSILAAESNYILHNSLLCRIAKVNSTTDKQTLQLVVPELFKPAIASLYHQSIVGGHRGGLKSYLSVRKHYFFKGMFQYLEEYCKSCPICQEFRHGRPSPRLPLKPSSIYPGAFKFISMDIITGMPPSSFLFHEKLYEKLLKESKGGKSGIKFSPVKYKAILVIICDFSRYIIAAPLEDLSIETIFHYFTQLVILKFGLVTALRTDRGSNLVGKLFKQLHKRLGIKHITTSPAMPRGNGRVEKANGLILNSLKCYLASKHRNWVKYLDFICMALNSSVTNQTHFSPCEIVFGKQPRDFLSIWGNEGPIDLESHDQTLAEFFQGFSDMRDAAHIAHLHSQKIMKEMHDKGLKNEYRFNEGDLVYLKVTPKTTASTKGILKYKLLPKFVGPYRILKLHPDKNFPIAQLMNIESGQILKSWHNFRNLKFAYERKPITVDQEIYEFPSGFPAPREERTPSEIIEETNKTVSFTCPDFVKEKQIAEKFFPYLNLKTGQFHNKLPEMNSNNTVYFLVPDNNHVVCES